MPNKFITNLDLARQANIFSGETAVFQGGIQLGIPFSGFPTGVDTGTTVSLGVVDTQFAAFSGNTGTTVFNVTDPTSPFYSASSTTTLAFSPYTIIDSNTVTANDIRSPESHGTNNVSIIRVAVANVGIIIFKL